MICSGVSVRLWRRVKLLEPEFIREGPVGVRYGEGVLGTAVSRSNRIATAFTLVLRTLLGLELRLLVGVLPPLVEGVLEPLVWRAILG